MQYTWSLLKREMTEREKRRRHRDSPQRCRQNTRKDHHSHIQSSFFYIVIIFPIMSHCPHCIPTLPPIILASMLAKAFPNWTWVAKQWTRGGRGSHATGAGTGAAPWGIYSSPALKGRERGHACFPFHSPGTFTRPLMWVLNIYLNTGSNIVGEENRRYWTPLQQKLVESEGDRRKVQSGKREKKSGIWT